MEIELLTIGKTGMKFIATGIEEYSRRLKHYISYRIAVMPDIRKSAGMTETKQKEAEGEMILSRLQPSDYVILLDERGKEYTSLEFSAYINRQMVAGRRKVVFIIGGPYGFSEAVYGRADSKISLSRMTFNHEMVRLFFTEQLYRALTILRGGPYHHE